MSKLAIFIIAGGILAGGAGVALYVSTRSDPEPSKASQAVERAAAVPSLPGTVKVGKLANGRPIHEMAWTASGDLIGPGPDGTWVRISTSTGKSQPFSSVFAGGKGEAPVRAIGASVHHKFTMACRHLPYEKSCSPS